MPIAINQPQAKGQGDLGAIVSAIKIAADYYGAQKNLASDEKFKQLQLDAAAKARADQMDLKTTQQDAAASQRQYGLAKDFAEVPGGTKYAVNGADIGADPAKFYKPRASIEHEQKLANDAALAKTKGEAEPKITDTQTNLALYGSRMLHADGILGGIETDPKYNASGVASSLQRGSLFPERLKSDNTKMLMNAQTNFLTAVLRKESGASISPTERDEGNALYFVQPGDSQVVIEQKRLNRQQVIDNFKNLSGPAWAKTGDQKQYTVFSGTNKPPPSFGSGLIVGTANAAPQQQQQAAEAKPPRLQNGHVYYWNLQTGKYE